MKIGIYLIGLKPGQMGGIEHYSRELIDALGKIDQKNTYLIFTDCADHNIRDLPKNMQLILLRPGYISRLLAKIVRLLFNTQANPISRKINRYKCNVIHFPLQVIDTPDISGDKIISIMDLQHIHYPEYFSKADMKSRNKLFENSAKIANHIIAISEFTKMDLVRNYGIKPEKVSVIGLAHSIGDTPVKPSFELPDKYFFYPAAMWPHKNHKELIRAFAILTSNRPDFHLVLSGSKKQSFNEIKTEISKLKLEKKVIITDFMSNENVLYTLQHSTAMIYPSLFEGFGIPIIEAMRNEIPVACSDLAVLHEVGENFVDYFNPKSKTSIAKVMKKLTHDPNKDILKKAKLHSLNFTYEKVAADTLSVYEIFKEGKHK